MKKKLAISILLICISTFSLLSQNKPAFLDDVQAIKNYDKIYEPPIDPVLFIGSSSIRKWPDIQKDFCNHTVVNRGIGGAVINDIISLAFRY